MSDRLAIAVCLFGASLAVPPVTAGPAHDGLVDPTRPSGWQPADVSVPSDSGPGLPALKLQGVYDVAGRRSAVINGRRVAVGDSVMGAEVLVIDRHRVVVRRDAETRELVSASAAVKSPAHRVDTRGSRITQQAEGSER